MKTTEITIEVEPSTAELYLSAPEQQKRQLNLLLSLYIQDAIASARPLKEVIRQASTEAQANGLTPEILDELLRDE
ncbi:hypothetical protein [Bythopirellula goksoeyrii]|uniref:Uncharacterized protein n=1 Tax=Bythopirellula goksoeyrii TaxID=1400387 RepID=A0A5B9QGQ8_9BACT|nr:hypothetical protein [Bythopirellula goksoeyrii]QEG37974.1 hypothetical protein Pr1d_53220 [Bythopirellula goksoeyrii]